ncbi:hypothetical protein [Ornithinibacillus sp. FSL M8-0202]|uniref:hypothetical protein n=1 Tax=Ornithinibacillus sp. FSL M8-0202 TaxID=2921616 RepID=UPI0030D58667
MTLLAAFATDQFTVFVGDKRRTNVEDYNEYYDDMRKVFKINDRVIVGFSGDFEVTLDCLRYIVQLPILDFDVTRVAHELKIYLAEKQKMDNELQQTVILSGIDSSENVAIITMNHDNSFELSEVIPDEGHFNWQLALADINPHEFISESINTIIESDSELDLNRVIELAKDTVSYVSKDDRFVSDNFDIEYLVKF